MAVEVVVKRNDCLATSYLCPPGYEIKQLSFLVSFLKQNCVYYEYTIMEWAITGQGINYNKVCIDSPSKPFEIKTSNENNFESLIPQRMLYKLICLKIQNLLLRKL